MKRFHIKNTWPIIILIAGLFMLGFFTINKEARASIHNTHIVITAKSM